MTAFEDITGWHGEFQKHMQIDEHKSLFPTNTIERARNPAMKTPVE